MRITTLPTYKHANKTDFYKKTAVVIDVLRATSTITAVLGKGCLDVLPVKKIGDAFAAKNAVRDGKRVYCGGERDGLKLDGYDYGNSPEEYPESLIRGNHIILCTTNGTQAIAKAEYSDVMLMGCLNNASAVSRAALDTKKDIILLCSGTKMCFSADDIVTAGAIISRIKDKCSDIELDDLGYTALYMYLENKTRLKEFLSFTKPYKTLCAIGAESDIDYCFQEDISSNVPVYSKGRLVNL